MRVAYKGGEIVAKDFSLRSGGKEIINARLEHAADGGAKGVLSTEYSVLGSPPLAIAPFDAAKAKEHQAAWAKHLGVPVEITNSIGTKFG